MSVGNEEFFLTIDDLKEIADALEKGIKEEQEAGKEQDIMQSRKEFQTQLLIQTMNHAFRKVPYYKELAKQVGFRVESFKNPEDLRKISPLESEIVRKDPSKFVAEDMIEKIVTIRRSSGTTSTPVRLYVSREEIDAVTYYTRIMNSYLHKDTSHESIFLFVGSFTPIMVQALSEFMVASEVDYLPGRAFDKIIDDLLCEHKLPNFPNKISAVIVTSARWIRLLTKAMAKKGITPSSTGVTEFLVLDSVSEASKKWIKETWKADVNCIFSLAECVGGAYQCEFGNYHYDLRSYLEIIDLQNSETVKEGEEGRILITTLHPFQQTMPLIRYSTGDIVIRGPDTCKCGEVGTSFSNVLGKAKFCIYLGRLTKSEQNRKWIGHYEVRDAFEECPEYFIIDGYEAPIIKMTKDEKRHCTKIKTEICINKGVKKREAEKKAEELINKVFMPWSRRRENGEIEVVTELIEVTPYSDPKSMGFFEQH